MPRDNDKNNGRPRGPRSGPPRRERGPVKVFGKERGGKDRRDAAPGESRKSFGGSRTGDSKFGAKRPFAGKRPYAGKSPDAKPHAGRRDSFRKDGEQSRPPRFDRPDRPSGERTYQPREDRARNERPQRADRPDRGPRKDFQPRGDRSEARPARAGAGGARYAGKSFGDKRPSSSPKGEGFRKEGFRKESGRPRSPDRGPRKDFGGPDRGSDKPWQKRAAAPRDATDRRPPRDGARFEKPRDDKPKFDKPRFDRPRDDRAGSERPRFSRPREDRPERPASADRASRKFERPRSDRPQGDRPRFDRPREERAPRPDRAAWQEHPRSEPRDDRPRRDGEDESKIFTKRPAFGGRGAYRERKPEFDKRAPRAAPIEKKKTGERIAKIVSRAGLCSRRDAEAWITEGRVAVNGRVITSPALDVTSRDVVTIDGKPLPERERTRLFMFHKPRGLMTTHADPEGRPTVFDNLPEGLPRLISIGRLDFNTEGLLLLTNDGGLARVLELPDTGWLRRYRVRAHGTITQGQLDQLKNGVEVDGVKYGAIDAKLERDQGANVWIVFAIREGKNREVRNVLAHLGLEVNRLIRISYGPFQLGELVEGEVEEIKTRVLREQLGEKIATLSGADFAPPVQNGNRAATVDDDAVPGKKPFKLKGKTGLIADRKGRRVLVERSGGEEARSRDDDASDGSAPRRRPQRAYHGKRDIKPLDE